MRFVVLCAWAVSACGVEMAEKDNGDLPDADAQAVSDACAVVAVDASGETAPAGSGGTPSSGGSGGAIADTGGKSGAGGSGGAVSGAGGAGGLAGTSATDASYRDSGGDSDAEAGPYLAPRCLTLGCSQLDSFTPAEFCFVSVDFPEGTCGACPPGWFDCDGPWAEVAGSGGPIGCETYDSANMGRERACCGASCFRNCQWDAGQYRCL